MKIKILNEAGQKEALFGIGLNKKLVSGYNDFDSLPSSTQNRLYEIACKLSKLDGGHNKFLESICVWIDITAPLYWWKQMDTYRIGVTKSSESTMHTLMKQPITQDNFQNPIPYEIMNVLSDVYELQDFKLLNSILPQSYLQRRVVCTNYKALRNIISQRKNHKLYEWRLFGDEITLQIKYTEFITGGTNE